jgi:hypothetical protein
MGRGFGLFSAVAGLVFVLFAFQNCGQMDFGASPVSGTALSLNADGSYTQSFLAETVKMNGKVDLLFVVDESVSMNAVLGAVIAGFESISKVAYPPDSRMAVTNMAPAYYTDADNGVFDPTRSYTTLAGTNQQPGFLRLVDAAGIASFVAGYPSQASHFARPGCATGWFEPKAVNSAGDSCLSAATQISLLGTGQEAGLISLDQLSRRQAQNGGRLFRPGVLANVVFVSDTHDPGANYYNRTGAPKGIAKYNDLVKSIYDANPGLAGLKFHGIVPLPPAGHAALTGVTTLGNLPATLADSKISGEDVWDFNYLPFVAGSGGVAMHPVNNDWSAVAKDLVKDLAVAHAPSVTLAMPTVRILSVKVAGIELDPSEYTLLADGQTIQISANRAWPNPVAVVVTFLRF